MKMNKELEALEFICKILKEKGIDIKWLFKEQYNTIKQYILKAQEQEKENVEYKRILEVIKEKDLFEPTHKYIVEYSKNYTTYCKLFENYKLDELNKLTKEEFELLKRWLG